MTLAGVMVFLGLSTFGPGISANYHQAGDEFGFHVSLNRYEVAFPVRHITVKTKLQNEQIIVDYFPTRRCFNLQAGLILAQNGARFARPPVAGEIHANKVDPYIGIGYSVRLSGDWVGSVSAGIAYVGTPRLSIGGNAQAAAHAAHAFEIAKRFDFVPVIGFSIGYKF